MDSDCYFFCDPPLVSTFFPPSTNDSSCFFQPASMVCPHPHPPVPPHHHGRSGTAGVVWAWPDGPRIWADADLVCWKTLRSHLPTCFSALFFDCFPPLFSLIHVFGADGLSCTLELCWTRVCLQDVTSGALASTQRDEQVRKGTASRASSHAVALRAYLEYSRHGSSVRWVAG